MVRVGRGVWLEWGEGVVMGVCVVRVGRGCGQRGVWLEWGGYIHVWLFCY